MDKMTDNHAVEVLAGVLSDHGAGKLSSDGVVQTLRTQIARLREPAEAHCATCDCVPGMTPAIRFDATPAERDGAVRDHLIRMGWTPPAEAQAQGGGEVVAYIYKERYGHDDSAWIERINRTLPAWEHKDVQPLYTAPPSAPVASEHVRRMVGKLDQWRGCMSHNESYFGEPAGLVKEVARELAHAVDPIYPPKPQPVDPLAGVVIHTAAVPLSAPSAPVGVEAAEDAAAIDKAWDRFNAALAQQPAADGGFTAADMMDARQEGRKEAQQPAAVDGARPLDEWHENDGPVVWWKFPVDEPAWIGTPLDSDWPGYHTHWTPHPAVPALAAQPGGSDNDR